MAMQRKNSLASLAQTASAERIAKTEPLLEKPSNRLCLAYSSFNYVIIGTFGIDLTRKAIMQIQPTQQLDPRIKSVWRINDVIWIALICLLTFVPVLLLRLAMPEEEWLGVVALVLGIVFVALFVAFLFILPPIRYMRWRYELTDEFLVISKGIFWRKHYVIPFVRVQNTDTRQGPILRAFKLASVTVSTAAGSHEIPGLDFQNAEAMRDHAAELARVAREDV